MPEITLLFFLGTFIAGMFMFLAPCTFPLVPGFLAVLAGKEISRRTLVVNTLIFCLGFSFVFISLGLFAGLAGYIAGSLVWLKQLSGLLIIVCALMLLGVIKPQVFIGNSTFKIPRTFVPGSRRGSFLLGTLFSLGWSPCVGPIVASVLLVASAEGAVFLGAALLATFSLGLTIPFLLSAYFYASLSSYVQSSTTLFRLFTYGGGVMLLSFGVLLLVGSDDILIRYGTDLFYWLGLEFIFKYL